MRSFAVEGTCIASTLRLNSESQPGQQSLGAFQAILPGKVGGFGGLTVLRALPFSHARMIRMGQFVEADFGPRLATWSLNVSTSCRKVGYVLPQLIGKQGNK